VASGAAGCTIGAAKCRLVKAIAVRWQAENDSTTTR
jgi:hypothetical protein